MTTSPNTDAPPLRLHLRHVRAVDPAAGPLCTPGIRAWCRQHAIDLRTLCAEGIDAAAYPHLHDDPFVARVLVLARADLLRDVRDTPDAP